MEYRRNQTLKLWYDEPAPFGNEELNEWSPESERPDDGWEKWALPIANSYMGAMVFGRTSVERIQITENSLSNPYRRDRWGRGGINSFAELYIEFGHDAVTNYTRDLNLENAIAGVAYSCGDINYKREYFASYPDRVLVVRLSASQSAGLSFSVRAEIPYLKPYGGTEGDDQGKSGHVMVEQDTITLSGRMHYYNILFEGQIRVLAEGGVVERGPDGRVVVSNADSALILIAIGTNYKLESRVFSTSDRLKKLEGYPHPHEKVRKIMDAASKKHYQELRARHISDYSNYFQRVTLDLGGKFPESLTTDELVIRYRNGDRCPYLEELYFQYGRYLLIASSRKGGYPANLQGTWSRYDSSPWTSGYWHNINVQMNYWPAFNTNLIEMFEPYADYSMAYLKLAEKGATNYLKEFHPDRVEAPDKNGWTIGTGGSMYHIDELTVHKHSGPGTTGLTAKLFYEYYDFTRDQGILKDVAYPMVSGASRFLSKTVELMDGLYLTKYSASPEQGRNGEYYRTVGCAFDQQMTYETHKDTLALAKALGVHGDPLLDSIREQLHKLDPVQIGLSGQIKEYREEHFYGEIGEKEHRHISHLVALHPGNTINADTPEWFEAAKVTLDLRGNKGHGWSIAHKLNLWARVREGNRAYAMYRMLLEKATNTNLWNSHPPFQIDGNFGGTAGVAEMLLQSHNGVIEPLPALPDAWRDGAYRGLTARGGFEVSAAWRDGAITELKIKSNKGLAARVRYEGIEDSVLATDTGEVIEYTIEGAGVVSFATRENGQYTFRRN